MNSRTRNLLSIWKTPMPSAPSPAWKWGSILKSQSSRENIKAIREETWEAIHKEIIGYAQREKIETGRTIRVDSTAVETDIHHPTDSTLLADGIRVITRWLIEGKACTNTVISLQRSPAGCEEAGHDDPQCPQGYGTSGSLPGSPPVCPARGGAMPKKPSPNLPPMKVHTLSDTFTGRELARRIERAVRILKKVIDQTDRRVFKGEKVPASEKLVSFFEDHTDIIVKGRRDTEYGHKVFFAGGASR